MVAFFVFFGASLYGAVYGISVAFVDKGRRRVLSLYAVLVSLLVFYWMYFLVRGYTMAKTVERYLNGNAGYFVKVFVAVVSFSVFQFAARNLLSRSAVLRKRFDALLGAGIFAILLASATLVLFAKFLSMRFPMDDVAAVFFTLTNNLDTAVDKGICAQVVLTALLSVALAGVCALGLRRLNAKLAGAKRTHNLFPRHAPELLCALALLYCATAYSFPKLHVFEFFGMFTYFSDQTDAVDSEFYRNELVDPGGLVAFPDRKRNLVLVFLESMESSFQSATEGGLMNESLIPNLARLAEKGTNFGESDRVGGGLAAFGTGWTVAAMTANLSGLPFNIPIPQNTEALPFFLPNAVMLTDILAAADYEQVFMCGSDIRFASRDILLRTHGDVELRDFEYFKERGLLPADYWEFWGFEDQKLYAFARDALSDLARDSTPFNFMLLTVDTHMPSGYECDLCERVYSGGKNPQMKNAILCADRQIGSFVEWIRAQPWYKNTTVVIIGDHLMMLTDENDVFEYPHSDADRHWLDVILNPARPASPERVKNRLFTAFDMFPTILSAMGCDITGDRLGFGTDLFSLTPTLPEKYGLGYMNGELSKKTIQYRTLYAPR